MTPVTWLSFSSFPSTFAFLVQFFSFAGNFLGFISEGKVFGKVLTVVGFDVRKCMWVVEQDFDGISWVNYALCFVVGVVLPFLQPRWLNRAHSGMEWKMFPVQVRWQRLPWPFLMMTSQAVHGTWNRMSYSSVTSQTLPMTKWADNQVNQSHYQVYQYSCRPGKSAGKLSRSRHDYLTINEWGWVSYEELWRPRRVLSVEAVGWGG